MSKYLTKLVVAGVAGGLVVATLGAGVAVAGGSVARRTGAHTGPSTLPQSQAARLAATWLASQLNAMGYETTSGSPDLSDTALTVLALAAAGNEHSVALRALRYLEHHANAYVKVDGKDGPGQIATLILGAGALGVNPKRFDGTNLVTRLLKTMRTTGPDAGLFGAQSPTYDGAYRQGLALAALGSVAVTQSSKVGLAVSWLRRQQCADGGWESYRSTSAACPATDPATYTGPDTNSTALAIEGLEAQHAHLEHSPLAFYTSLQSPDGGWGYYGGTSDPDSTSLVVQALLAMHQSVSAAKFQKGANDPVTALLSFQLSDGAFFYPSPPSPNTPSKLGTEQAIPALAKKALPF